FIKPNLWNEYLQMRKAIKKPATEKAQDLAIAKLTTLHEQGENINAVIEQSIFNNWQGLFPVKKNGKAQEDNRFHNQGIWVPEWKGEETYQPQTPEEIENARRAAELAFRAIHDIR
ncbi:MAG: hypothetical protein ABH868_04495, partial [bacterium]